MLEDRIRHLKKLTEKYFHIASSHISNNAQLDYQLLAAIRKTTSIQDSQIPVEGNQLQKFGDFQNQEFVVMMTDIRNSTRIINGRNGDFNMFLIFYLYAGIVANIVEHYGGTTIEFLGDGVLSLFDTSGERGKEIALQKTMSAARDIFEARELVLNPFFIQSGLPTIDYGIGIDQGQTIITRFGYRSNTELKAFGRCTYNASKLSKGRNTIQITDFVQSHRQVDSIGRGYGIYSVYFPDLRSVYQIYF